MLIYSILLIFYRIFRSELYFAPKYALLQEFKIQNVRIIKLSMKYFSSTVRAVGTLSGLFLFPQPFFDVFHQTAGTDAEEVFVQPVVA